MNQTSSFDPKTIINPFYAISLTDDLFGASLPKVSNEDWILLNASLIEDIGVRVWLDEFLDIMSQSRDEYDGHDIIDPTLTVSLSTELRGSHEALVERHEWIVANIKLMGDMGTAKWLDQLLNVLSK